MVSKDKVEEATFTDNPWINSIPMHGISSCHIAKCNLDGTIKSWILPNDTETVNKKPELPKILFVFMTLRQLIKSQNKNRNANQNIRFALVLM